MMSKRYLKGGLMRSFSVILGLSMKPLYRSAVAFQKSPMIFKFKLLIIYINLNSLTKRTLFDRWNRETTLSFTFMKRFITFYLDVYHLQIQIFGFEQRMKKTRSHFYNEQEHNVRSASHKIYRETPYLHELTIQSKQQKDIYFYPRPLRYAKPTKEEKTGLQNKYDSLHVQKDQPSFHKRQFKKWVQQQMKTPFEFDISFQGKKFLSLKEDDREQNIRNQPSITKNSSPIIKKRKFKGFTASVIKKQGEKSKVEILTAFKKQNNSNGGSRYASSSNFNASSIIRKHKANNVKQIQRKLRSTVSKGSEQEKGASNVREYIRKCGHAQESKIFIFNSQDSYIQRILQQWGWVQNEVSNSPFYHLKWSYMPSADEKVGEGQLFNHFKNNHELTSKSYLTKNIKNNQSVYGNSKIYYPKCFDIGNPSECEEFIQEYEKNVMMVLLQKVFSHFSKHEPRLVENLVQYYGFLFRKDLYCSSPMKRQSALRNKKFKRIQFENYKKPDPSFIVHANIIIEGLKYWRNYRKDKQEFMEERCYHFLKFKPHQFKRHFPAIKNYTLKKCPFIPTEEIQNTKEFFCTPSYLLIERVVKEYVYWCQSGELQFIHAYGYHNIWIIKPSSTARGSGIYLSTDLNVILSSSKAIQCRIVQKYIEEPFIIRNPKWKELDGKKFDLRQWVLLKGIDPLQIYIFSHCYLRICADKYSLDNIVDMKKHLTNYSINKNNFKAKDDSVYSIEDFITILWQERGVSWSESIQPKITDLVISSIKSCQQNLEDYGNNCFQLLGYDILLSNDVTMFLSKLKPWLLQINMSPACEERTDWLKQYLYEMGHKLLNSVLPQELLPNSSVCLNEKYRWDLICKQSYDFNRKRDVGTGIEVIGCKIDLREDVKQGDRKYQQYMSAIKIQRFMRKYVGRYKRYKQEKKKKVEKIKFYFQQMVLHLFQRREKEKKVTKNIEKHLRTQVEYASHRKKSTQIFTKLLQGYFYQLKNQHAFKSKKNQYLSYSLFYQHCITQNVNSLLSMSNKIHFLRPKILFLQQCCRNYLHFKISKKRKCEKYIQTLLSRSSYSKLKIHYQQKQKCLALSNYFTTFRQCCQAQSLLKVRKAQMIKSYMKCLEVRRRFLEEKLKIFQFIVNRILKVSKRRKRGKQLKQIIKKWKLTNKLKNCQIVEKYFKAFLI